jgi:para-nitrobenzyl esterase
MNKKYKIISTLTSTLALTTFGVISLIGTTSCSNKEDPVVQIANGKIKGTLDKKNKVVSFKGIPYAAAMNSTNRFSAPSEHENWSGIKDCKAFGKNPLQLLEQILGIDVSNISEDCLTLNV